MIDNEIKKFDVILMNPPYGTNLHLKFLRKCKNIAKYSINISPINWVQDPFAKYKRSTLKQYEDVAKHIDSITQIDDTMKAQFDIEAFSNLGIYLLKDTETNFDYKNHWELYRSDAEKSIIQKVCFSHKTKYISDVVERGKRDGIRVMIADIGGNRGTSPVYKDIVYTIGGNVGDKDWTECKNMGGYPKPQNSPLPNSIKFDTIKEAEHFWNSYRNLRFFKVLCDITIQRQNIQLKALPFLKSYKKKITDNDMYKLFELSNDEIQFIENYPLKNGGKKFDVVLMNPPYGNRNTGDEFLHHKFVEKCLNISDKTIVVMPNKLIYDTSRDKNRKHYKELYDNRLITAEECDSSIFTSTNMPNVAIFTFDKTNNGTIKIIDINGNNKQLDSLLNISQYNDFEKEIIKYLEIDIKDTNNYLCQVAKNEVQLDKWLNNLIKRGKTIFLTANSANGGMNGTFFSKTVGKIFTNIKDLKNNFKERKGAVCNIMLFDTFKAAENCKDAMMRPLLRFALYRTQDDQNLRKKCFAYIPNINWEDPQVKTDEGLLEVCGCPKDKCKEYADYCKKIIEEVDKKKNGGKKFDVVLMNPPYDKNLHLKFLEKTIAISNNVVSVQPSGWLTDTFANEKRSNFKKYENTILKHLADIEIYDWMDASIMFGIISHQGVAIFNCNEKGGYDYESILSHGKSKKIIDIIKTNESLEKHIEYNKVDGIRVRTQAIKNAAPSAGTVLTKRYKENIRGKFSLMYDKYSCVTVDGYGIDEPRKWWSLYGNKNKYTKAEGEPIPCSIKFNSIEEAKNFENYCKTDFFIYCMYLSKIGVHSDFKHLPWMGNVKWKGKSGKIDGYKYPITDEMLYEYFNVSKEEIEIIKNTLNG